MLPVSIELSSARLDRDSLDYLRAMTGREARARVLRGGQAGASALLSLGGFRVSARVQGAPLREGATVFVRVEKSDSGGFILRLLETPRNGAAFEPPGKIPTHVFARFLRFLDDGPRFRAPGDKKTSGPRSNSAFQDKSDPARVLSALFNIPLSEEKFDGFLFEIFRDRAEYSPEKEEEKSDKDASDRTSKGEREGTEKEADQERGKETGKGNPSQDPFSENREQTGRLLGFGDLESVPAYYFFRFETPRTGAISSLVQATGNDFSRIQVFLACENLKMERILERRAPKLKEILRSQGVLLEEIALLKRSRNSGKSLDLRA